MSGWVPVALAEDVGPATSAGTRIDGAEFVVWRDAQGQAHVWEDRCPHRGMRLSFGFVRGNHIACLYHGWQFDTAGQCRLIPAHPDIKVPKTIRATGFASVERLGMVWVCREAAAAEPPAEEMVTPVRSLAIEAPIGLVCRELGVDESAALARLEVLGLPVMAGLQSLSASASAVHLVIAGARPAVERKRMAVWGMALRDAIERAAG